VTFQVKILGANGALPAYGRHHSAQLVSIQKHTFLIDCGEGTQLQLSRYNCRPQKISHIFISHLHGDHYFGLMGLLSSMHLQKRTQPLYLHGPRGLKEIISLQLKYSESVLSYPLHLAETSPNGLEKIVDNNSVEIFSFPLEHRVPCTGFLFREKPKPLNLNKQKMTPDLGLQEIALLKQGKNVLDHQGNVKYDVHEYCLPPKRLRSYAYCSDTRPSQTVVQNVTGVDLLYHESTFLEEKKNMAYTTYHSTARQAAEVAREAGVGRLLLGHYSARYKELDGFLNEATPIFPATQLALEGETYCIDE
jgi:ribonuclease Z